MAETTGPTLPEPTPDANGRSTQRMVKDAKDDDGPFREAAGLPDGDEDA